ncbi:MAG: hypothetical protein ChlgKO_10900 [Chlamydiales bacterium]
MTRPKHIADLKDFYENVDAMTNGEKKELVASVSYRIQQVRGKVMSKLKQSILKMNEDDLIEDFMSHPSPLMNKKLILPSPLGLSESFIVSSLLQIRKHLLIS